MNTLESNVYRQIAKASGRSLYLLRQEQEQGWQDPVTAVSLPGANSSTSAVTSSGAVTVGSIIPVTPSMADLLGIVDLQADGLDVTLSQDWPSVSQIAATLSIPSGSSLTGVTGAQTAYAGMFKVPNVQTSNLAYYMSQAHRVSEVSMDIGGQSTVQYKFLRGPNIRRVGFLFLTADGFRDVGNSLGLDTISFNIGNSDTPISLSPRAMTAFQSAAQRRFETPLWMVGDYAEGGTQGPPAIRSSAGMGCYWYDGTLGLQGRDWIRTDNYPSESVNFTFEFAASCPAGSRLVVVLDRYTSPRSSAV
jgi:hypothetical protein